MAPIDIPPRPRGSRGESWVFQAPPSWPVPPDGWEPPEGWHPNPSWAAPPPDWQFWHRKRRGTSFYIKTAAAVLTFAATMAGAYFAFRSQPHTPTMTDWVRQANATCDRDVGSLQLAMFDGSLPSADQTPGQNASAGQQTANRLRDAIMVEGSLSKLNGDLAGLPLPGNSHAGAIQAVLHSGNALVAGLDAYSGSIQSELDSGTTASAEQIATEVQDGDRVLVRAVAWQRAIKTVGLTSCPFYTASPPSVAPTLTPQPAPVVTSPGTGTALSASEQQLADELNPDDLTDCTGRPDQEVNGVFAAVNCESVQAGPAKRPLVVQFSDFAAAQAWFTDNTPGFVDQDNCAAGFKLGTWDHDGILEGPFGCAYTTGADFRMVWVDDANLVGIIADGANGQAMYSWWTDWAFPFNTTG